MKENERNRDRHRQRDRHRDRERRQVEIERANDKNEDMYFWGGKRKNNQKY